jgi:hypothetical protein
VKTRLDIPKALDGQLWRYRLSESLQPIHQHLELELDLVLRGEATLEAGGRRIRLRAGGLVWLFPGEEHGVVAHSDDFEMWIACFAPRLVRRATTSVESRGLRARAPMPAEYRALTAGDARRLAALFAEVSAYGDAATYNAGLAHLLLHAWQAWLQAGRDEPLI